MITFRLPRPGIRLLQPNRILVLLWLFLLVFPKGGFKIAGVPLTWGYFLLGLISIFSLCNTTYSFHKPRLHAYLLMIPFQLIATMSMFIHGVEGGMGISFILNFFFLPWFFFMFLSKSFEAMDLNLLFKLIKIGVFLIAIYGIFLFFYKFITGKFIEIPFLTINYHDFGEMESKCIDRGFVFKLISTYNNGNIYGICLLMLLPLYQFLENTRWRKILVAISLILTLSRTVWLGLVFSEIITSLFTCKRFSIFKLAAGALTSFLTILIIAHYFGFTASFLLDQNLGGRISQLKALEEGTLFPNKSFSGFAEIVYLGVLGNFGILGLIAYLICMTSPMILFLTYKTSSLIRKCILCGLANFLFVSFSDGALLYIPVLVFYWFLSSLVLRRSLEPI